MQDFLEAFLNWEIMREASPILWQGLRATLLLSLLVVPLGLLGGIILAVLSTLPSPFIKWPLQVWVDTFRALPPLVLLIFI
ncbi:MAG: ABC transporter permease subunit, partial [Alphaproteobacteria bacterium]